MTTIDKEIFDKIDMVLKYICKADKPPFRKDGDIYKDLGFDNNSKELIEILLKLEKDKYVHSEIDPSDNIKKYFSTFDGRFFLTEGAYKQEFLDKEQKRKNIERIERITNRNNCFLTYGTIAGSIIALALLILEIIKFCCCS
jgi:hypothetical protein